MFVHIYKLGIWSFSIWCTIVLYRSPRLGAGIHSHQNPALQKLLEREKLNMANQTVIVLDVGPSMSAVAPDGSPRKLDVAVKAIMLFLQRMLDGAIGKVSIMLCSLSSFSLSPSSQCWDAEEEGRGRVGLIVIAF
jgi:hypothetical protein